MSGMFNLQAHTAMTEGQQSPVKEAQYLTPVVFTQHNATDESTP